MKALVWQGEELGAKWDIVDIPADMADQVKEYREKMVEKIPPGELVIQWDLAVENRFLEAKMEKEGLEAGKREAERLMAPAADICPYIPKEVELGYHSCFGTLNGWPSRQPSSLLGTVLLLNAGIAAVP